MFVTIHHATLDEIKNAEALSYCWGNPADKTPIFANGKLLYIPSTLWRAIRRLYPQNGFDIYSVADPNEEDPPGPGPAVFWADAICISQEDNLEKNHQVAFMN